MSPDRVAEVCPAGWHHEWEADADLYELTNPSGGWVLIDGGSLRRLAPEVLHLLRDALEGASEMTGLLIVEACQRNDELPVFRVRTPEAVEAWATLAVTP